MATRQQLEDGIVKAHNAGDFEAAREMGQMIKEGDYEEVSSPIASALQGIGAGATVGLADEMAAAIRAGAERYVNPAIYAMARKFAPYEGQEDKSLSELYSEFQEEFYGEPIGQRYREALASQREALETAREEDPWTTGIAEAVGGLGMGGVGLGRAAAQPTLRAAAARVVPGAAALGGAAGYGYSEGDPLSALMFGEPGEWKQEMQEAATQAGTGVAFGAGLGAAAPVVGAGLRSIARVVTAPFTKNARLTNEAKRQINDALAEDIEMGHITNLETLKGEMRDLGLSVADAGPMTRQLTERLAQTPTRGGREIETFLTARNKDAYARLYPELSKAIGSDDNFGPAYRRLMTDMADRANQAYEAAYDIPVRLNDEMQSIIANPEFRRAIRTANRIRRGKGMDPLPETLETGQMMDTRELDYILRGMDDAVSTDFKTSPGVAREVTKPLRNRFRELLYDANPRLAEARAQYANDQLNEEAMQEGLKLFSPGVKQNLDNMREMSDAERTFFKIGALRAIVTKLGDKSDTSDFTKAVFDTPNKRAAMRIAFDSDEQFNLFERFVEGEQKKFNTFKAASGNSSTAKRIMQQDPGLFSRMAGLMGFAGTGSLMVGALASRGARMAQPALAREGAQRQIANIQAPMLMSADPAMIDQLQRGTSLGGLLSTGGQPSVGVGLGGLLSTSAVPEMTE